MNKYEMMQKSELQEQLVKRYNKWLSQQSSYIQEFGCKRDASELLNLLRNEMSKDAAAMKWLERFIDCWFAADDID